MSQFDDALNNVKSMKSQTGDTFMDKAKQTIKGSAMGAVVGLMYGWYNQKNVYVYGVLGAIGGGLINYALLGFKKEK
jgi:uncharacterized protein YcfJ